MTQWLSHKSFLGHLGGYGDRLLNPISWATHGKWTHFTSDVLPEKVNAGLSNVMKPFDKVDETINPVRKIPIVDRVADIIKNKPGDALAIAAGAFFGGAAALGGGGAAGAGGAGGGAAAAGEGGAGAGALGTTSGFGGVGMDAAATGVAPGELAGAYTGAGAGAAGGGGAAGDFTFNAAQDSQAANAENGLQPVTTDDTLANIKPDSGATNNYQAQQQQQKRQQRPLDQLPVYQAPTYDELAARFTVPSSRALKTQPGFVSMRSLANAGASGKDQVSQNGVHIGAIRALHTEISRLEDLARRRGIKV